MGYGLSSLFKIVPMSENVALHKSDNNEANFGGSDLFVDPSVRGQGQGRKLIEAVAEIAKKMGCLRLQWLTKHDNTRARGLYDTMAQTSFVQYRMSLD